MRLGMYELEVDVDNNVWFVRLNGTVLFSGTGVCSEHCKNEAICALEKHLDDTKKTLEGAKGKIEDVRSRTKAFQWFPGCTLVETSKRNGHYYYKGKRIQLGCWIFPEESLIMSNNTFRRLFNIAYCTNRSNHAV